MSTSFHIIPTKIDDSLTFQNVLTIAAQTMNIYLQKLSINLPVELNVAIRCSKEEYVNNIGLTKKFIWTENEYAWFSINNSNGGTDAYCEKLIDHLSNWTTYIEDTLDNITVTSAVKQQILECEYEWYFRRSVGQSPIVNLAYGHLAAALAKLTDGYIYSHDGAWTDNNFPTTADYLLEVYLYPDKTKDPTDYDLATRCIDGLRSQIASSQHSVLC